MGWLIVLAVLILLAILPLGAKVRYDSEGFLVRAIAGPIQITLFPRKKKTDKPDKAKDKKQDDGTELKPQQEQKSAPKDKKENSKGGSILDFMPLVNVALDFLGDFRRKLRVNYLEMKLVMGGGDPCDLAVNYGKAWAALGNLMPHLERLFVIKKRDLQVECDFTAENTTIYVCLDLTITLGRLISLAVRYGIRALREFLDIQKKRKGGASK
ncbi:MAG: DUF2953 domain-containing protein [Oscillospiraceae bacterium]|nr:DUF2953 domain-containing protein [Oscillospiraceae bacterium]